MSKRCVFFLLPSLIPLPAQDLADVFSRVLPSVVTIQVVVLRADAETPNERGAKVGSGVLLDREGMVLTAGHVVNLADELTVQFADGTTLDADVVAAVPGADLALVQVRGGLPDGATPCKLGDSDSARVGNQVFVVGAPMGMGHTLTVGYLSARRRDERFLGSMRHIEHFQTDTAINPGNSGGPLFNRSGEVIGIVCHIAARATGSEGIGFAVTSNAARELLLEHRDVWLGFDGSLLPLPLARALNVPDGKIGMLVTRVAKSSPAERAGLRAGRIPVRIGRQEFLLGGDVVLEMLGFPLGTPQQATAAHAAVRRLKPDSMLRLTVLREGEVVELAARIREN